MELNPLFAAVAKTENIAIIILVVICALLLRALIIIRKEDREDRALQEERAIAAQTRNNIILDKIADALIEMRITLATRGIRDGRD